MTAIDQSGTLGPQVAAANWVWLNPVWVPVRVEIDEVYGWCAVASAGSSFRLGVYESSAQDTPAGLGLVAESGNIAAAVGVLRWTPASPFVLEAGTAWPCLASEDAVMRFTKFTATNLFFGGAAPMLGGTTYVLGGWGAFTDPCPAVVSSASARWWVALHVSGWDV